MSLRLNLSFSTTCASYPAIFVGVLLLFFFCFLPASVVSYMPFRIAALFLCVFLLLLLLLLFSSFHNILLFVFPVSGRRALLPAPYEPPKSTHQPHPIARTFTHIGRSGAKIASIAHFGIRLAFRPSFLFASVSLFVSLFSVPSQRIIEFSPFIYVHTCPWGKNICRRYIKLQRLIVEHLL